MGQQSILRLLLRFSVPAVFGMMVQALYNVVDRIYIGNSVGSLGIGATTIAMPIMMIGCLSHDLPGYRRAFSSKSRFG
ncbi:MAG: hypothetical protein HQ517_16210 [SAR324 cluster bacterium]|nr:hypothetical protein [SAR324 cluster bacterium]